MSLSAVTATAAGPTISARGAGSDHLRRRVERSMARLPRMVSVASPESGWSRGITNSPPSPDRLAVSTRLAGPTSSMAKPSMPTTTRDTGAPRTQTRSFTSSERRVVPTE